MLDEEGTLLGSVDGPNEFHPLHIGEDFVLGRSTDEDDLAPLQTYELIKRWGVRTHTHPCRTTVWVVAGCAGGVSHQPAVTVGDFAGIAIITTQPDLWVEEPSVRRARGSPGIALLRPSQQKAHLL